MHAATRAIAYLRVPSHTSRIATDKRMSRARWPRYTHRASSAVHDGMRKHSPCPLTTTTGAQRIPGVQVRLVAESPKASKRLHLNPGFKVVFAGIAMAEDVFFCGLPLPDGDVRCRRSECGRA